MIRNSPTLWPKKAQKVTLTLTGTGDETYGYIEINGTKYYTAQTIDVEVGTEVYCVAYGLGAYGAIVIYGESTEIEARFIIQVNSLVTIEPSKGTYNIFVTKA